jgi:hypothetical protein
LNTLYSIRYRSVILSLLLMSCGTAAPPLSPAEAAAWRRDLDFVVTSVTRGHAEPFHATSEAEFRRTAQQIDRAIPNLASYEVIVAMGKLVASVGDGHTRLPWPWDPALLGFHVFPVQFEFFSDGIFIVAAAEPYTSLVGGRVTAIGRMNIDDAVRAVSPLVSRDNPYGIARVARRLLAIPEVLHAVAIAPALDRIRISVFIDGRAMATDVLAGAASPAPRLRSFHQLRGTSAPLHRSAADSFYWKTFLDNGRTLYAQINTESSQPRRAALPSFCQALLADAGRGVERIIVDLRHNGGGSRELMLPCVEGFRTLTALNRPDRLFVVVGNETFSAALGTALDFANRTQATIVGEPTGGRPNFFGETRSAKTPEHHLPFTWASKMNWRTDKSDTRESLVPSVLIHETFADFGTGRDPVLEWIREHLTL